MPNNRSSLEHLKQKPLASLLVDYVNWRFRLIRVGPRKLKIDLLSVDDTRWLSSQEGLVSFFKKVELGEDLNPHLSKEAFSRGYAEIASSPSATIEQKWQDKDFLLNTMGYHHFHLGIDVEENSLVKRTKELVFARVSRDEFYVIAIFDHSVFVPETDEWSRLRTLHYEIITRDIPAGSMVVAGNISSSGHSVQVVMYAQRCMRVLAALDPKLDDVDFVRSLYVPIDEAPVRPRPTWCFNHLDLAIYDKAKPAMLIVQQAWD